MKARYLTILLMLAAAVLATVQLASRSPQPEGGATASCADLVRGCRVAIGGRTVEASFSPAPLALQPFLLTVTAPHAKAVFADFSMAGMDMGASRYRLQPAAAGVWRAKVMLPVCVAGRSDWVMTLEVDGEKVQVPFTAGK